MRLPDKISRVIRNLYRAPTFEVEVEGNQSNTYTQDRGIRQGCPLSPYLFVIVMACLFKDIKDEMPDRNDLPDNVDFREVLYADDTILIGKDHTKITQALQTFYSLQSRTIRA